MSLKSILAQLALAATSSAVQAVLESNRAQLVVNGKPAKTPPKARKPKVVKRKVNTPSLTQ
jgi:hypothetical protein